MFVIVKHKLLPPSWEDGIKLIAASLALFLLVLALEPRIHNVFNQLADAKQQLTSFENELKRLLLQNHNKEHFIKNKQVFIHHTGFKHDFLRLLIAHRIHLESLNQTTSHQFSMSFHGEYADLLKLFAVLVLQSNFVWLQFELFPVDKTNLQQGIRCIGVAQVFF